MVSAKRKSNFGSTNKHDDNDYSVDIDDMDVDEQTKIISSIRKNLPNISVEEEMELLLEIENAIKKEEENSSNDYSDNDDNANDTELNIMEGCDNNVVLCPLCRSASLVFGMNLLFKTNF